MHSAGMELLLDLSDCSSIALNDPTALEDVLAHVAQAAGFDVVSRVAHKFTNQGVTLVLILSQSHIALHSWPEDRIAVVDVYVCGEPATTRRALDIVRRELIERLGARSSSYQLVDRSKNVERPLVAIDTKNDQV